MLLFLKLVHDLHKGENPELDPGAMTCLTSLIPVRVSTHCLAYRDFSQGSSQRTTCQHPKQKPTNISLSGFRSLTLKKGIPSLTQRRGSNLNQFAENSQLAEVSYFYGILTLINWK